MIEGLKIKVSCDELREHLIGRSGYHRERAEEKAAELPGLKEAVERITRGSMPPSNLSHMNKTALSNYHFDPGSAVERLEEDIRDHRNKALVFTFFAEHLFDEDYVLTENDLVRLEILKR